jgi:[NiFe] hydrogenase diaphorase moiety large subunit
MNGSERVAAAFCEELGIQVGETTPDGKITLEHTPCIGMCDQAPAALVNDVVVTNLHRPRAGDRARPAEHMIRRSW